jgi:hypothetical protein
MIIIHREQLRESSSLPPQPTKPHAEHATRLTRDGRLGLFRAEICVLIDPVAYRRVIEFGRIRQTW